MEYQNRCKEAWKTYKEQIITQYLPKLEFKIHATSLLDDALRYAIQNNLLKYLKSKYDDDTQTVSYTFDLTEFKRDNTNVPRSVDRIAVINLCEYDTDKFTVGVQFWTPKDVMRGQVKNSDRTTSYYICNFF